MTRHSEARTDHLAGSRPSRQVNRLPVPDTKRGLLRACNGLSQYIDGAVRIFYAHAADLRDSRCGGRRLLRALGHGIFTEAESWDELRNNVLEAVSLHFEDAAVRPRLVQMHYVKDELIPLETA